VRDANGQALAHIYYEEEPGRQSVAKLLSKERQGGLRGTLPNCWSYCERANGGGGLSPTTMALLGTLAFKVIKSLMDNQASAASAKPGVLRLALPAHKVLARLAVGFF
jgi:hypothetical protein